ncbi:MAG: hypothetical protein LBH22_07720 [Bacteroidales bacterium]|jgi:type II secretory pathway pseudopilin PulG|nr:hypothetical protein [Bacteroidales bacterium]
MKDSSNTQYLRNVLVIVATISAFSIVGGFACKLFFGYVSLSMVFGTIVLAFIGVLATFIVVSNYAQVAEIKKEFEKETSRLNGYRDKIDEYEKLLDENKIDINNRFVEIEKKQQDLDLIFNDGVSIELNKIRHYLYTTEYNPIDLKGLDMFADVSYPKVNEQIQRFLERVVETIPLDKLTYRNAHIICIYSENYCRPNSEKSIYSISKEVAYNIIYDSFIKTQRISPAMPAFLLLKYLKTRCNNDISETLKNINNILYFDNIKNSKDRDIYVLFVKEMEKYLNEGRDLRNPTLPNDIQKRIDEEIKK